MSGLFYRGTRACLVTAALLALLSACAHGDRGSAPDFAPDASPRFTWRLVWSDEFGDGVIDPAKWKHEINCSGGGNDEAQCYTARRENSLVDDDGILRLLAREEVFSGPARADDDPRYDIDDSSATRSYTSARIRSKGLFEFRYGRVEVRAKLPGGQGSWPALWMMPASNTYGSWPSSGEIDIMEAFNLETRGSANGVSGALHYGLKWPQWSSISAEHEMRTSPTRNFHTYMIEWEADEIRWFVDGVHYQTQHSAGWYNYIWSSQAEGFVVANPRAPFDHDFYLIMNLAIGGHAVGLPDSDWDGPRELLVDYVRVYQCDSGRIDGTGCANAADARIDPEIEPFSDKGAPTISRFPVFEHGPAVLDLKTADGALQNRLLIGSRAASPGRVSLQSFDEGGAFGESLAIDFSGPGSAFIASADMSAVDGIDSAVALEESVAWSNHGTLEFDLFVESIDTDTTLLVGLDSGLADHARVPIETLAPGRWNHVAIPIAALSTDPPAVGRAVDLARITRLLVLEANGGARLRLDNVTLNCVTNDFAHAWQHGRYCGIEPVRTIYQVTGTTPIFTDAVTRWKLGECCAGGSGGEIVADDVEPVRGNVVQFSYSSDETVGFFKSETPMDFSLLAGGTIEFDLLVLRNPDTPAPQDPWMMQVTCVHPCGSGDVPLSASVEGGEPRVGVWQRYTFDIDDLVERGLKLARVDAPLVVYPRWGNQKGAVFRVDNIIVKPAAPAP